MFIRNLRRELSSLTAAFSGLSGDGGSSGLEPQGQSRGGKSGGNGSAAGHTMDLMSMGFTAIASAKGHETGERHVSWTYNIFHPSPCGKCV